MRNKKTEYKPNCFGKELPKSKKTKKKPINEVSANKQDVLCIFLTLLLIFSMCYLMTNFGS